MTALVALTDVELEVLEAAHLRALAPDHLAPPTSASPGSARQEALASLVARGVLGRDGELVEHDDLGRFLGVALDIRVAARAVVVLDRVMGPQESGGEDIHAARLLHLTGAGVCVEDQDAAGVRALGLVADAEGAAAAVTAFLVPPDAVAGEGEDVVAGPGPDALMRALRGPSVLAELSLLLPAETGGRPAVEQTHLLALGPGGCFRSTRPSGPGAREEAMRFTPVAPGWAHAWMLEVCGSVPDQGLGEGTMTG